MQEQVEAVKADDSKVEAAELAVDKEQKRREYYYNWHGMPRGQR